MGRLSLFLGLLVACTGADEPVKGVVLPAGVGLAPFTAAPKAPAGTRLVRSDEVAVAVPADWSPIASDQAVVAARAPGEAPQPSFTVTSTPWDGDLAGYRAEVEASPIAPPDAVFGDAKLGGLPAFSLVFDATPTIRSRQRVAVYRGRAWSFVCTVPIAVSTANEACEQIFATAWISPT